MADTNPKTLKRAKSERSYRRKRDRKKREREERLRKEQRNRARLGDKSKSQGSLTGPWLNFSPFPIF